jgi:hypothetical protein
VAKSKKVAMPPKGKAKGKPRKPGGPDMKAIASLLAAGPPGGGASAMAGPPPPQSMGQAFGP